MIFPNRWKELLFCLFLAFFITTISYAEEYINQLQGFKLNYPDNYEKVDINIPNVVLALRTPGKPYPTLNVMVQPGTYLSDEKLHKDEDQRIIDSYRAVGILDARLKSSVVLTRNQSRQYRAEIQYRYNNLALESLVGIIQATDKHFIITCIDLEGNFPISLRQFSEVLDSFQFLKTEKVDNPTTIGVDISMNYIFILLGVLLIITITILIYKRFKRS